MADNEVDQIYSTQPQVDFARRMAEALLKKGGYTPDASMAVLPGSWMYGVGPMLQALSGAQYRDIAGGQQEKLAAEVTGRQPNQVNRYGARISQPNSAPRINYFPQKGIETGSINPSAPSAPFAGGGPMIPPEGLDTAQNSGQPPSGPSQGYVDKLIQIESGGNPNIVNKYGYRGLGQFNRAEEQKYGINDNNWRDPAVQRKAIMQSSADKFNELYKSLGRPPTEGELYLAHQQGVGGATNHLQAPDLPAWMNMYKTAEGRRKGEGWAKRAIWDNIPNGHPLKAKGIDNITSSEFSKLWTSRFDNTPSPNAPNAPAIATPGATPPNAIPGPMPPPMGLGGPTEGTAPPASPTGPVPGGPPATPPIAPQLAQAQGIPQVPSANPQITSGNNFGGFGIPPANPAYHPQQLDALIRSADPKDYPKIINDYFKQLQGTQREDVFGGTDVRPSGVPGVPDVVTHMAPKTLIPLGIEGLNLNMYMTPQGPHLLLPGGGDKGFSTVTDLIRYAQQMKAEGEATGELTKQRTSQVAHAQDEGMASVPAQRSIQQMMAISKATGRGMPSGPTKDFMKQFGQFYDNFVKGDKDKAYKDLPEAEAFDKLNSYLASESTKAITSRGTNFDLQTFMRANPSLSQTKEGRELMLDILNQEFESKIQLGIAASKFKGKDVGEWQQFVKNYYDKNPITVTLPTNGKRIIMKKITKEERDLLPSGTGYIAPDNNVYYKK